MIHGAYLIVAVPILLQIWMKTNHVLNTPMRLFIRGTLLAIAVTPSYVNNHFLFFPAFAGLLLDIFTWSNLAMEYIWCLVFSIPVCVWVLYFAEKIWPPKLIHKEKPRRYRR
jgi:hypothetical protein